MTLTQSLKVIFAFLPPFIEKKGFSQIMSNILLFLARRYIIAFVSVSKEKRRRDQISTTIHKNTIKANLADLDRETEPSFFKRILIVDDDPDITYTLRVGLEQYLSEDNDINNYHDNKTRFEVYTHNNPLESLSQFKPGFYDLLLTDIDMPYMNGFELNQKILELDANVRVCYMSAADLNIEALREIYPKARSIGWFIKKPFSIHYLAKRLKSEIG